MIPFLNRKIVGYVSKDVTCYKDYDYSLPEAERVKKRMWLSAKMFCNGFIQKFDNDSLIEIPNYYYGILHEEVFVCRHIMKKKPFRGPE